jgi:hypothetical protein
MLHLRSFFFNSLYNRLEGPCEKQFGSIHRLTHTSLGSLTFSENQVSSFTIKMFRTAALVILTTLTHGERALLATAVLSSSLETTATTGQPGPPGPQGIQGIQGKTGPPGIQGNT